MPTTLTTMLVWMIVIVGVLPLGGGMGAEGSGAPNNPPRIWFTKVQKPFGDWHLLALYNWSATEPIALSVSMERLGLPADEVLLAYDRWKQQFVGPVTGHVDAHLAPCSVQLLALYPQQDVPQIIAPITTSPAVAPTSST